jgi:hypothetical protein
MLPKVTLNATPSNKNNADTPIVGLETGIRMDGARRRSGRQVLAG